MTAYSNPVRNMGRQTAGLTLGNAPKPKSVDVLIPAIWEIAGVAAIVLFYIIAEALFGDTIYDLANIVGPTCLIFVLALGALRMILINPLALWVGLFSFRVTTMLFFGVGAMVHLLFNASTLRQWQLYFPAEPENIFKLNIITALSVLIVFVTAAIMGWFFKAKPVEIVPESNDRLLLLCAIIFSVIGYAGKYFLQIPTYVGLLPDGAVPSIFLQASQIAPVGLFLLTLWFRRYRPRLFFIPLILLFIDVSTGVLLFTKIEVLRPIIIFMLAIIQDKVTRSRLIIFGLVLIFTFKMIVPVVEFGRAELDTRYRSIRQGSLSERLEVVMLYFSGGGVTANFDEESQNGMARLSYANAGAAAVTMYDNGRAGTSMNDIFIVLIPRFVWPDKPILNHGERFNEIVNGSLRSSSWMGLFAEAYWNFGWAGIPLMMIPLGIMFVVIGRFSITIMSRNLWLHFPIVLFGMSMGVRTDGQFASEMVGPAFVCLVTYIGATAADGLLRPFLNSKRLKLVSPLSS